MTEYQLEFVQHEGPCTPPRGDGWEPMNMSAVCYAYSGWDRSTGTSGTVHKNGVWIMWRREKP